MGIVQNSDILLWLHLGSAILGQCVACVASVASLLYLWQRRILKTRQLAKINIRMPPLEPLEKILFHSLWSGFVALSIALTTGGLALMWDSSKVTQLDLMETKIAWALLTWGLYLGTLIARHWFYVSWRNLAKISLVGLVLLSLLFLGVFLSADGGRAL